MHNQRPEPGTYAAYFDRYLSLICDEPILDVLQQLKEDTYTFFTEELDVTKGDHAYAEGKWTVKEVIGHLIDAERTFAYRAMAFARGQKELPGFDENAYVENADFNSRLLKDLATEYRQVREANMYLFRSFSADDLRAVGISNGNSITVRTLVYLVAGHEIHHMNIIKERYL